jgi:Trk K+ transport system NAD-binding subunit
VARGETVFVPEPDTVLHAGDILMASVKEEAFSRVERYMED